nr:polysaccharide pyruvyl transferase family protein [uncultured Acetatifactor sp.]
MNSGATWKIFTNGAPYDEEIVDRLLNDLGIHDKKNKLVLPRAMDAESLVNNITSFEKIISFRLHSHIIAASFGIPSYGFAWDSKVREFFSKLDAPQRCKELAEKIDYECLFEDVNKDLNDIEDIKKQADLSKKDLYRQLVGEMS